VDRGRAGQVSMTGTTLLTVEQVPIDQLRPDPANPRRIGEDELDSLERSLRQFGFVQPVLARREDGVVIGGHQRLLAARRLGLATVPVTYLDLPIEQARLLNLALNKIGGSFDDALLARLLADLGTNPAVDLTLSGFGEDEIKDLLRSLETREKREQVESFDLDEALAEATRSPRSKPGDLWVLGDHRLLCGNSTDPDAVARLLDGAEPRLLATDPPYGVSYDASWRDGVYNALGPAERTYMRIDGHLDGDDATAAPGGAYPRRKGGRNTTISGDTRVDWSEAFALVPSLAVGYIWHAGVHAAEVAEGLQRIGFENRCSGDLGQGPLRDGSLLVSLEPRALLGGEKEGRQGPLPRNKGPGHDLASAVAQDDHGWLRRAEARPPYSEAPRPLRDSHTQPPQSW
jgi:hypothetical protein